jgi:hypothetical protein
MILGSSTELERQKETTKATKKKEENKRKRKSKKTKQPDKWVNNAWDENKSGVGQYLERRFSA